MTLDIPADIRLQDAAAVVCDAWQRGWTIPPKLTVSQHADAKRIIAEGAGAEPGPWRTARNPPQREIMDSLSEHVLVRRVSFIKPVQWGATEILINWCSYVIDHAPASMLVCQPTKDLARSWAGGKFQPAIDLMPDLRAKISNSNTLEKVYPGGTLWAIWANSSNQLRQRSPRYIAKDELDEYPLELNGQGSASQQIDGRNSSHGTRGKTYETCTPTTAGSSQIDKAYTEGDQRRYYVPCPHCHRHQTLTIEQLQPDGTFACAHCGIVIDEHHKTQMLIERRPCATCGEHKLRVILHRRPDGTLAYADTCDCGTRPCQPDDAPEDGAYWQPHNPDADPLHRSYHIWSAYTPVGLGPGWKELADMRAEAEADPAKQATFYNLRLAKVFEGERQAQDSSEVEALAEPGMHLGTVPPGGLKLTCGVDWQHDRAELTVLAHGRGQRTWVVDYAIVPGDPSQPDGYDDVDRVLQRTYRNTRGHEMAVEAVAMDGGYMTEMVAQYIKKCVGQSGKFRLIKIGNVFVRQHMYLVRGRSQEKNAARAVYRPAKTEVNQREKTLARSIGVWGVGTSVLKQIIYARLGAAVRAKTEAEKSGDPDDVSARLIRFPGGRGEAFDPLKPDPDALPPSYYAGLTCEYFDLHRKAWVKPAGKANEPLDTMIYALWAALSPAIKIDLIRAGEWDALEARLEPPIDLFSPAEQAGAMPDVAPDPAAAPARSNADVPRATPMPAPQNPFVKSEWSKRL